MKKMIITVAALFLVLVGCTSSPDKEPETHTVTGIVAEGTSMNILQIETTEGKLLTFATEDAEIEAGANGIVIGATVDVTYTGELVDGETATAQKVVVTKEPEVDPVVTVDGIITEKDETTITMVMGDGISFRFITTDVKVEGADELLIGQEIRIYYQGVLNSRQEIQDVVIDLIEVLEPHTIQPLDGE